MSERERERLKDKEQRKNPGGTLNNMWDQRQIAPISMKVGAI